jgi:hypothetical protein
MDRAIPFVRDLHASDRVRTAGHDTEVDIPLIKHLLGPAQLLLLSRCGGGEANADHKGETNSEETVIQHNGHSL